MHKTKFNPKWENAYPCEMKSYIEILMYLQLVDLPSIKDSFLGSCSVCVCVCVFACVGVCVCVCVFVCVYVFMCMRTHP